MISIARGFLPCLVLLLGTTLDAGAADVPLHDTGQTLCWDMDGQEVPCSQPNVAFQDGRFGRDVAAADGVLPKTGGGSAGFDFTKIANNGSDVSETTSLGTGATDWACTRDNQTGLLWEIKISNPASPRHYEWAYTWYNPDPENDGGDPGEPQGVALSCMFTLECNSQAYVNYINSIQLCGRSDWRLPSLSELHGLVHYQHWFSTGGSLDPVYFADGGGYRGYGGAMTADTMQEPGPHHAYTVEFDTGAVRDMPKGGLSPIRLVAGEQYVSQGPDPVCGKRENPLIRPTTAGAFSEAGPGLVHDRRTDLVWMRCAVGQEFVDGGDQAGCEGDAQPMGWEEAMQRVAEANEQSLYGHDDWRLPNIKEWMSLDELRCAQPIVDTRWFPNTSPEWFWTSTSFFPEPNQAWAVTMEFGHQLNIPKPEGGRVMMVRGGAEYDDYSGAAHFSVGGQASGMVGGNAVLRLDSDAPDFEPELLTVASNGGFAFITGLPDGSSYSVSLEQAPVPHQECHLANPDGIVAGAHVTSVQLSCDPPPPARIELDRTSLSFEVTEGGQAAQPLGIANTGGGILDWRIGRAYAPAARGADPSVCEGAPGLIVHDDGSAETGYGGAQATSGVYIVDRFSPPALPASIGTVCVALVAQGGVTSVTFDVVVIDDNGPQGAPGEILARRTMTATGLPQFPADPIRWYAVDIGDLYTTVDNGDVYVGVYWQSQVTTVFVAMDTSEDRPPGYAGGYSMRVGNAWTPLVNSLPAYRSMLIRALPGAPQMPPTGCDNPLPVPWLSAVPGEGETWAGEQSVSQIRVNAGGVLPGDYQATLCVTSSDGSGNALVEVPVSLTVTEAPGMLAVAPGDHDFGEIALGSSAAGTFTLSNGGAGAARGIELGAGSAFFQRSGGTCPGGSFDLAPGQDCTVEIAFAPLAIGSSGHTFVVDSDNAGEVSFTVTGAGVPGPAAALVRLAGSGQSAVTGQPFAQPLAVQVRDAWNNPVSGVAVGFSAPASGAGAQLSASEATTDGNGYAAVWATANGTPGAYAATASAVGQTVQFELQNQAAASDLAVELATPQTHVAGGGIVDLSVVVTNLGPDAAEGVEVLLPLPPQIDAGATVWQCLGPATSGCTAQGQGAIGDSGLSLPAGGAVVYLVSAPVALDAQEPGVDFSALVNGGNDVEPENNEAQETVRLVLWRDGFEAYGSLTGDASMRVWEGGVLSLPLPASWPEVPSVLAEGRSGAGSRFQVHAWSVAGLRLLRLAVGAPGKSLTATPWHRLHGHEAPELHRRVDESGHGLLRLEPVGAGLADPAREPEGAYRVLVLAEVDPDDP